MIARIVVSLQDMFNESAMSQKRISDFFLKPAPPDPAKRQRQTPEPCVPATGQQQPELSPFSREQLSIELDILRDVCRGREVITIQDVVSILHTLQPQTRSMLSEVEKLIKLCLALPISVAASERSFSALRRLKTWLRNTMKQERLTHLAIMNAHSDLIDECDVSALLEEFISRSTERRSTFGKV